MMDHPIQRTAGALALFLCISACTYYSNGPFEVTEGRFFDENHVEQIDDSLTTEEQILEWFGSPWKVETKDNSKMLRYFVVRNRKGTERGIFRKKIYLQNVRQELSVEISAGIVQSHTYESTTVVP
jgi:outer membrane protein assembly factor BamE (lipoprotein component of BamABCDE complex)